MTRLVFPLFKWALYGPELGIDWVICRLLCGSQMGYTYVSQLILAKSFPEAPSGLIQAWTVRGSNMVVMCVIPLFKWAFGELEVGTDCDFFGPLCGSQIMGCSHGIQLMLATDLTKVPIELANVWFDVTKIAQSASNESKFRFGGPR